MKSCPSCDAVQKNALLAFEEEKSLEVYSFEDSEADICGPFSFNELQEKFARRVQTSFAYGVHHRMLSGATDALTLKACTAGVPSLSHFWSCTILIMGQPSCLLPSYFEV